MNEVLRSKHNQKLIDHFEFGTLLVVHTAMQIRLFENEKTHVSRGIQIDFGLVTKNRYEL